MQQTQKIKEKQPAAQILKDTAILLGLLVCAGALCLTLRIFDSGTNYVSMVFVLAVFLIARFTRGYVYGIAASLLSVMAVNYIFTYPYFAFNFTLAGYPLAIVSMLAVSVITSTLTSQTKRNEAIRIEAEKEKTRSNLLRAVSHDLRTPLTGILGATSAVIENDDTLSKAERLTLLQAVQEDAQWLIRMVENLLAVTKINGDTSAQIVKQPEAAEEVVAEAVSKFKKRFAQPTVNVQVPEDLLLIPMDAMLIQQVIINLLENAVLHGETADTLTLCVTSTPQYACFTVQDNGVGIPAEVLPHIFEGSFRQTDAGKADSKRNMGIGLSVCNTIIRAHGGSMSAKNTEYGGAAISFTLPLGG